MASSGRQGARAPDSSRSNKIASQLDLQILVNEVYRSIQTGSLKQTRALIKKLRGIVDIACLLPDCMEALVFATHNRVDDANKTIDSIFVALDSVPKADGCAADATTTGVFDYNCALVATSALRLLGQMKRAHLLFEKCYSPDSKHFELVNGYFQTLISPNMLLSKALPVATHLSKLNPGRQYFYWNIICHILIAHSQSKTARQKECGFLFSSANGLTGNESFNTCMPVSAKKRLALCVHMLKREDSSSKLSCREAVLLYLETLESSDAPDAAADMTDVATRYSSMFAVPAELNGMLLEVMPPSPQLAELALTLLKEKSNNDWLVWEALISSAGKSALIKANECGISIENTPQVKLTRGAIYGRFAFAMRFDFSSIQSYFLDYWSSFGGRSCFYGEVQRHILYYCKNDPKLKDKEAENGKLLRLTIQELPEWKNIFPGVSDEDDDVSFCSAHNSTNSLMQAGALSIDFITRVVNIIKMRMAIGCKVAGNVIWSLFRLSREEIDKKANLKITERRYADELGILAICTVLDGTWEIKSPNNYRLKESSTTITSKDANISFNGSATKTPPIKCQKDVHGDNLNDSDDRYAEVTASVILSPVVRQRLLVASKMLYNLLSFSPHNHQAILLYVDVMFALGAPDVACRAFDTLHVANIQHDVLGYILWDRLGPLGAEKMLRTRLRTALNVYKSNFEETPNAIVALLEKGVYSKAREVFFLWKRLHQSCTRRNAIIESWRWSKSKGAQERRRADASSMKEIVESIGPDSAEAAGSIDNREFFEKTRGCELLRIEILPCLSADHWRPYTIFYQLLGADSQQTRRQFCKVLDLLATDLCKKNLIKSDLNKSLLISCRNSLVVGSDRNGEISLAAKYLSLLASWICKADSILMPSAETPEIDQSEVPKLKECSSEILDAIKRLSDPFFKAADQGAELKIFTYHEAHGCRNITNMLRFLGLSIFSVDSQKSANAANEGEEAAGVSSSVKYEFILSETKRIRSFAKSTLGKMNEIVNRWLASIQQKKGGSALVGSCLDDEALIFLQRLEIPGQTPNVGEFKAGSPQASEEAEEELQSFKRNFDTDLQFESIRGLTNLKSEIESLVEDF